MDTINQCSDLWIDERYLVETKLGANGGQSAGSNFPFLPLLIYVGEEFRLLASRA